MGLNFAGTNTNRVNLPSGFGDNQHAFTWLFWSKRTATTSFRRWASKGGVDEKSFLTWNGSTDASFIVKRATTNAQATTSTGVAPADSVWTFWAVTYDETDGPRVFKGGLGTEPAEVSYASRVVGAGASSSDAAQPWCIGNDSIAAPTTSFVGVIGFAAHYRRRMSLIEIKRYWLRPVNDADCDIFSLLGHNGTASMPNLSTLGSGQNGTVTGTALADFVPIAPLFGGGRQRSVVSAADGITAKSASDSGSGTETIGLDVTHLRTETASGTEVSALLVNLTLDDSVVGGDASTVTESLSLAVVDAGTGSDSATVSVAFTGTDVGSGLDSSTLAVALLLAEAAVGSDSTTLLSDLSTSDLGSGIEGVTVLDVALLGTDAAAAIETSLLSAALLAAESAAGTESASAGEQIDETRSVVDSGVGSDIAIVAVSMTATDRSSGEDCRSGTAYIRMRR